MGVITMEEFDELQNDGSNEQPVIEDEDVDEEVVKPAAQPDFDTNQLPEVFRGKSPQEIAGLWNEMERASKILASRLQQVNQQQQQQPEPPPKISSQDLLDGDDNFNDKLERFFAHKARPFIEQSLRTTATQQHELAFKRYPHLVDYRDEVNQLASGLTIEQAAQPAAWDYIASQVTMRHMDEIATKRQEASRRKPPPPDAVVGDGKRRAAGGSVQLTKEQKAVAKALGVSEKEYAAYLPMFQED